MFAFEGQVPPDTLGAAETVTVRQKLRRNRRRWGNWWLIWESKIRLKASVTNNTNILFKPLFPPPVS
jgi:hypothetical protein